MRGLLALTVAFVACDVSTLVAAPVPTSVPGAVNTIVVLTAQAAENQTAAAITPSPTATATPLPTKTPTEVPSPTRTFIFVLATLTKTPFVPTAGPPSGDLGCKLVDQSPADDSTMSKNQTFSVTWKVQNTGAGGWDSNSVDFIYLNGAKLASSKVADLPKSVASGGTVDLKLTMTAPGASGSYKTVWTLRQGKNEFCHLTMSIVVP